MREGAILWAVSGGTGYEFSLNLTGVTLTAPFPVSGLLFQTWVTEPGLQPRRKAHIGSGSQDPLRDSQLKLAANKAQS